MRQILASAATLLLTYFAAAQSATPAGSASFELHLAGKSIGKASYTLVPGKRDLKLTSRYTFRVGPASGDFADEFRLDSDYTFVEGTVANKDTQRQTSLLPSKTRTELVVSSFLGGAEPATFIPIKPNLLVFSTFDAGAAQAILLHTTTHPSPDNKYSVFLTSMGAPSSGRGGRGKGAPEPDSSDSAATTMPPGNAAYDGAWIKGRDVTGTLDGKPLPIHTYLLGFSNVRLLFFADDANNLMQLNLIPMQATYLHTGFKLDPIPPTTPVIPSR